MAGRRAARRRGRRLALVIAAALGANMATAGIALAYFSATGAGSGSATAGTLTISVPNAAILQALYPGGSADVALTVNSPSSTSVQVTSVTAGTVSGCTTPDVTLVVSGPLPTLAPGANQLTLTGAARMGPNSSADCQGAALSMPIIVAVQQ